MATAAPLSTPFPGQNCPALATSPRDGYPCMDWVHGGGTLAVYGQIRLEVPRNKTMFYLVKQEGRLEHLALKHCFIKVAAICIDVVCFDS